MALVGGRTVRDTTRRILLRLLSPALAQTYSFAGRRGKLVFRNLVLWTALNNSVKLCINGANEREVEISTQEVLKHAKNKDIVAQV